MATNTTKLQLVKPAYNDVRDINVLNNNFDKIDTFATNIEKTVNDNKTSNDGSFENLLLETNIKGTSQIPTIVDGKVTTVEHKNGDTVIRKDTFEYSTTQMVEKRELIGKDKSITLTYNLLTLETVVS